MRKYLIVGSLSLLFIIGCAGATTYFIAPGFTGERLILGGIAVLPVLVKETDKRVLGTESPCRFGEQLASGLRMKQPALKVIGPTVVSYTFDKEDLMSDYFMLIEDYQMVGTFSTDVSEKLSQSLGVEYFMFGRLHDLYSASNDAKAGLSVQIWNAEEAEMVFGSNAECKAVGLYAPPYDRAMSKAVCEIVNRIPMVLWGRMAMHPCK